MRRGLTAGLAAPPDEALVRRTLAAFDDCYRENLFRASRLYPDVASTLETLRQCGLKLGCITNKRERYACALLEQAGILANLDFVYGGDRFDAKKPDPKPLRAAAAACGIAPRAAVMIGDSTNDRRAAEAAGFAFIFAAFGDASPDDPALAGAHATISRFADLNALLCPPRSGK